MMAVPHPPPISTPGLTRLSRRVAGVACRLPMLLGPEQPFLPFLRFGVRLCLDLRLPFGLHGGFGDSGSLAALLALRFGGLYLRASRCLLSASSCGSLLNLCLLTSSLACRPFRHHSLVDRRPGLVLREGGAAGDCRRLLTLLKSWILKYGHA